MMTEVLLQESLPEQITLSAIKPSRNLLRLTGKAIGDHQMIREGDRVLIGLSGGKDSFSLLMTLRELQRKAPIRFDLGVVTIDPQSPEFDPSSLKDIIPTLDIPYFYESYPIVEQAKTSMKGDSFCAFCSRMRRGLMYKVARREGYNVLALAQHLDDLAETFLMSALYGGKLRTMQAHYTNDAGDLRIIRPFIYVREKQTRDFAIRHALPIIPENCPACFGKPTERYHMKQVLGQLEQSNTKVFNNLLTAMRPLMTVQASI